jgi:hypothetical protein
MLGIQCVLKKFAKLAPAKKAKIVPKKTYIKTMNAPYKNARRFPPFCLVKKLTVMGIKGYTHGVNNAKNPAPKAMKKKENKDSSSGTWGESAAGAICVDVMVSDFRESLEPIGSAVALTGIAVSTFTIEEASSEVATMENGPLIGTHNPVTLEHDCES